MSDAPVKPTEAEIQPPELPVTFGTFVVSLASSAAYALGDAESVAEQGAHEADLPLARHTIDCLAVLQDKTRGNLSDEEDRLLRAVLHDLRLRFIQASKR